MSTHDHHGHPMGGAHAPAAAHLDDACAQRRRWISDPLAAARAAIEQSPACRWRVGW